jgi:steroid delta-isomerase-like uncharacterized protein
MTREELVALAEKGVAAWNAHDPDAVAALYAPDAKVRDSGGDEGTGRDAVAARCAMFINAFPDLRVELLSIAVDGNKVCEEWRVTGTHEGELMGIPPTHKRTVNLGCSVTEVSEDGLTTRETAYWDAAKMLQDLGVMPQPEAQAAPA